MKDILFRYKSIIAVLSGIIVCLLISNYIAYSKLSTNQLKSKITLDVDTLEVIKDTSIVDTTSKKNATIVLVIDDFGYRNDSVSDGFLDLNIPITCAIIPGHLQSRKFAQKAFAAGKEVIIHMPMESSLNTPGEDEYKIKSGMTSEEVEWRIREVLKEMPEAIGMNNHQGSKATTNGKVMSVLGSVLKANNKFFIDSRTTSKTVAEEIMRSIGVPTIRRHVFLDNDDSKDKISERIDEVARLAQKQGIAVAIGHAKPNTLKAIKDALPKLLADGYQFEFASNVVK
jgi:polysaccharide deacetylase 2 family uncharacterized protein YibQ|tara:strand:- start:310 stop:1164 length:855 start_codon:yes stop_codon:yes gene_type:complete